MGLFKRMSDLLSANLNDMLERCENPERMLKQAVRDMETALGRALDGAARAIAHEKLLGRQLDEHRREADRCRRQAEEQVRRNDDAAARTTLRRKAENARNIESLSEQLLAAESLSRRLRGQITAMRLKLAEARRKLLDLTARNRAAQARRQFAASLQTRVEFAGDGATAHEFDRAADRIALQEAETDALLELLGEGETETLDESEIEAELQQLKATCCGQTS